MLLATAAVLVGFILLVWSADLFVDGAASIAENLGLSPIIIGLTIVSIGTSAPEILVSIAAALSGAGELAIGNAVGSNIANVGLVLGISILVAPMNIHPGCVRSELPMLLAVTIGAGLLLLDIRLSRVDAILMLVTLVLILIQMARTQMSDPEVRDEASDEPLPHLSTGKAWAAFGVGLALLIGSSRMLVWGASGIASSLGVSELMIGLTIVAVGTSLPELAASVASAVRGHAEIAIGNVIGSNLFNLLAVLPMVGLISPQSVPEFFLVRDYVAMTGATFVFAALVYYGRRRKKAKPEHAYVGRLAGTLLVTGYAAYYALLFVTL